jgi:competence protein ComEA
MALASARPLVVLLVVVLVAGTGVGIGHWRRAHPDLEARLERLDLPAAETPGAAAVPWSARAPAAARPLRPSPDRPLDVNRASPGELTRLPGVGPALAARIVAAREQGGRFASVDDLRRVRGISRATLERLRPLVAAEP